MPASAIPTRSASQPLREAIAAHYRAQYEVAVEPGEVVVTTGSSAAFQLAFLAAFEAGDRVALAAPGYPAYRNILSALGIEPVLIEVGENTHYQPNPELLAEAGPLDGLIVASPANPTGTMISADRSGIARRIIAASAASASFRMRSITVSLTRAGLRRCAPSVARRSSSTRFRNITA